MKTLPLPTGSGEITALSWSPDGTHIAGVCDTGLVLVWQVASGSIIFEQQMAQARLLTVAWSPGGRCLALGGEQFALTILQVRDGALVCSHLFQAPVNKIAWSPRGERFLVAAGTTLCLFLGNREAPIVLSQAACMRDAAWSPTGGRFATVCADGSVQVYNALRRREAYQLTHSDVVEPRCVAWSADGQNVGIGTAKGLFHVHDGRSGQRYTTYALSSAGIEQLCWNDPYLVARDQRHQLAVWHVLPREASGELTALYPPGQQAVALSRSGHLVTSTKQMVAVTSAQEVQHAFRFPSEATVS